MRVSHIRIDHQGRATIYYEGADAMSDYCPLTAQATQKYALKVIAEDGSLPGAYVTFYNARTPGEPWPADAIKAKAFAKKAGLPFKDMVWFPRRITFEEAVKDQALEPNLKTEVRAQGGAWVRIEGREELHNPTFAAELIS